MYKQIILWGLASLMIIATVVGVIWVSTNSGKVKDGMNGSNVYTKQDLENAYNDGYNKAFTDKDEYLNAIAEYRDTIMILQDSVSQLTIQNEQYKTQTATQQASISSLQTTVNELQQLKSENQTTINGLNSQIQTLQNQLNVLLSSEENHSYEVSILQQQISSLQTIVSQLQSLNNTNTTTINSLNAQILGLNNSMTEMSAQAVQNTNTISILNGRITDLENSILYYEQLLGALQVEGKVVVTFEVDNAVYNVQSVNANSVVTIQAPSSTQYLQFLGWSVDGSTVIDLSTYTVTENTKFIAVVVKSFDVKYMYENTLYDTKIVVKDNTAPNIIPAEIENKIFKGWSIDGNTLINLDNYHITQNTVFYAVVINNFVVEFKVGGEMYSYQLVTPNTNAQMPTAPARDGHVFVGWALSGTNVVDINNFVITANTVFNAVFGAPNGYVFSSLIPNANAGYINKMLQDGNSIYLCTDDSKFYIFNKTTQTFGSVLTMPFYSFTMWTMEQDNDNIYIGGQLYRDKYNYDCGFVVFNKITQTFTAITNPFGTSGIKSMLIDNDKIYVFASGKLAIFNKTTQTFGSIITTSFAQDRTIFTMLQDEINIYMAGNKHTFAVFNKTTQTFSSIITNPPYNGASDIRAMVQDGDNIYLIDGYNKLLIFNKTTQTFSSLMTVPVGSYFRGAMVQDGNNIYIGGSTGLFVVFNKITQEFDNSIVTPFNTEINAMVQDGNNIYVATNNGQFAICSMQYKYVN